MPPQIADTATSCLISAAHASPIADPSSVLLLMMPLIADAAAFQLPILVILLSVLLYFAD